MLLAGTGRLGIRLERCRSDDALGIPTPGGAPFGPPALVDSRQRSHQNLFDAFKLVFNTNTGIDNNGGYMKFAVSSVKDLNIQGRPVDLHQHK